MQPADTLTVLFRHHLWANLRLLERCADLTAEQLEATSAGAYGSIRDILEHIVQAEQGYFSRISTGQRRSPPADAPPMTLADMADALRITGAGLLEWVQRVEAADSVLLDWDGTQRPVPKTIILVQVINHGTEHREQVKAILTELGIEPPDLQSWAYYEAIAQL